MTIATVVSIFEPLLFLHVFTTAQIRDHNAFDEDTAVGKDLIMSMNPSSIKVNVPKPQKERKYERQIIERERERERVYFTNKPYLEMACSCGT